MRREESIIPLIFFVLFYCGRRDCGVWTEDWVNIQVYMV